MITPLWKYNVALAWSVLGLPLGYVCIGKICGWLAQAMSGPNVAMDYTPFVVLSAWALVLYGLIAMVHTGSHISRHPRHEVGLLHGISAPEW
jgi:hypothetical protein